MIALEPSTEGDAETAREVRAFAVRFVAAAPALIAKDVDVGAPERESLVVTAIFVALELVVLGAPLVADGYGDLEEPARTPHRGQADRLRKHRRDAGARHAVQPLAP